MTDLTPAAPAPAPVSVPPWTFGVGPLPQTVVAADRLRQVISLLLALEHPDPAVDDLLAALDAAQRRLGRSAPADPAPRVGAAVDGAGRAYLDHSRHIGAFNPCFPDYEIAVDGDHAEGTVNFPIAYEGPPGLVHGGFLALFFDAVIQHHNCDLGLAGKTAGLALRYRRPTPLRTDLRFVLIRSADGPRIRTTGRLLAGEVAGEVAGDVVLCEAELDAVKGDRARLPDVSPRRAHP
ncbi:hypothetical protein CC117_13895 [Parafrankia colletiae]|uniref:Thioesterase domain-containing protein n=1 Tax=Parafrankia colletiae TaxID=573497 RepID=A0A1S1R253_9ACTN|nr:hypothetical protein [Parafrankia colletiae]MCK9900209.1 hypothetical protein [Frankia sp. Cpl3]OHV40260.1 hypothetical protein CC117_13895 [Parafrankia colletiae]